MSPTLKKPSKKTLEKPSLHKKKAANPSRSDEWKPTPAQKKMQKITKGSPIGGLFARPGVGKTSTMLDAIRYRMARKEVKRTLIVAPASVILDTWPSEIEKYKQFRHLKIAMCYGKWKDKEIERNNADIYLMSVDGLLWLNRRKDWAKLSRKFDMIILDESSKFKNHDTKRFKFLKQFIQPIKYRYLLTGTPAPRSLINLWPQLFLLDGGERLSPYITHFRNKYFHSYPVNQTAAGTAYGYNPIPTAKEDIVEKIKDVCIFINDEEYQDLPPIRYIKHRFDMPPKVKKLYREFEDDLFYELDNGLLNVANAGAKTNMLQQITNGAAYLSEDTGLSLQHKFKDVGKRIRDWTELHTAKIDRLKELMDELDDAPTLILYNFKHDRVRLEHHLKSYKVEWFDVRHTGKIVRRWNNNKINFLLANPSPLARGLNMQKAKNPNVIWFAQTWDYETYYQLIKRFNREGAHSPLHVHHLIMNDTIDDAMYWSVNAKRKAETDFLAQLNSAFDHLRAKRS